MSETQLSHIRQRKMGGVQSDKREVGKELHREDKTKGLLSLHVCSYNLCSFI